MSRQWHVVHELCSLECTAVLCRHHGINRSVEEHGHVCKSHPRTKEIIVRGARTPRGHSGHDKVKLHIDNVHNQTFETSHASNLRRISDWR